MAINNMTAEDRYSYTRNKYLHGLAKTPEEQAQYQQKNEALRQKYGIESDDYSFEDINIYSDPATMIGNNDDYNTYVNNKARWDEIADKNSDEAKALQAQNQQIRDKYGILGDNFDAASLQRYNNSMYANDTNRIRDYNKYLEALDEASAVAKQQQGKSDALLKRLDNFEYDPNTDTAYQNYKKAYEDLGNNAYKNAVAQNNATTSGRSNSYANTAAANAQLTYNNQASQAIPQFSQDAYNRLYQNYQASLQNTQNAYGNMRDVADMYGQAVNFQYGMNRNAMNDRINYNNQWRNWRDSDLAYDYAKQSNPLELAYLKGRNKGMDLSNEYTAQAMPYQIAGLGLANESTALSNEGKRMENYYYPQMAQADINNTIANTAAQYSAGGAYGSGIGSYGTGGTGNTGGPDGFTPQKKDWNNQNNEINIYE